MKNDKITKIYSILLLISIFITGLSNVLAFATESEQSRSKNNESCDSKFITGKEIFKTMEHTNYIFFRSPDQNVYSYFRGDTHLFWELKDTFKNIKFSSYGEFEKLFNEKFEEITKREVKSAKSNFKPIYVDKYNFGGISGGLVTPYHWFEIFLPCVKNICFDKFNYTDNSNDKEQNSKQNHWFKIFFGSNYSKKIKTCINNICFSLDPKKNTATVLGRENKDYTELRIPAFIKYNKEIYKVTEIDKKAFCGDWHLLTVSFDGHIDKIGDSAFDRNYLVFIDMHKGIDHFGKDAFLGIPRFARFIVPEGEEEDYAKKLGKSVKTTVYSGEEEKPIDVDLFIGTNDAEIIENYRRELTNNSL